MKQKETKIDIAVNILGTRFAVKVPFSEQDAVRATEAEMKAYLSALRQKHPTKSIAECMAMMAYDYAKGYFALKAQRTADLAEAEELLRATARLCGEDVAEEEREGSLFEFGEF